jgi:Na+/H+-dicarboxylate symporter/ABC-type amino acid transport substrate-binding protein
MTFSRKILVGLTFGILTGLVLGELVAPLQVIADGFVRLLQMTVLPYVTVSIISSLGSLNLQQARLLGLRCGLVVLALWAVAFAVTWLMPLTWPATESASFFSTTLIERRPPFDFVALYIPSNPFNALANNVVPAVVLFSVIVGVALIGVEPKATLLDVLRTASTVIARATRVVVGLTPYGLFAIAAVAAGTLTLQEMRRIQIYLVTYVIMAMVVALWVLPGLIAALTGIRIRDLFGRLRDSLIVAFVAGDLFIVLPGLIEGCKELLARQGLGGPGDARGGDLTAGPDVIVPVSFNFPHTGKLLSLSFIPFAAWFADEGLSLADYPQLFGAGLLSFFGSLNSAVPFLLDLFDLPADTFQLFLATGVINSRFGTLLAAMHTVTVAIVGSVFVTAGVRWDLRRLMRFGVATAVVVAAALVGLRVLFATGMRQEFAGADLVYSMQPLLGDPPATIEPALPSAPAGSDRGASVIDDVRARRVLRVLVLADRMPFAFENRDGRLVGLDIEMARTLAKDLAVEVQFFQTTVDDLAGLLAAGVADIAMTGLVVTPDRAAGTLFSTPYLDETLAFVTRDHLRDRFRSWDSIRQLGTVKVGIPDVEAFRRAVASRAPGLELVPLRQADEFLTGHDEVMAYVLPAERGSVLTLLHPAYSVVVPQPDTIKLPIAYPLARGDERWVRFINTWLELKQRDGTIDALYRHWILGEHTTRPTPRWSVLRNVLHWVD